MRIGLDIDGVLADFNGGLVRLANKIWPKRLPKDYLPKDWDYSDVFTKEDLDQLWMVIKQTPDFWLNQPPYIESVIALQYFWDRNPQTEIFFVTSRIETCLMPAQIQSEWWLGKHKLYPRTAANTGNKSTVIRVSDPRNKKKVLEGLKLPFMLDDKAETVADLQNIEGLKAYVLDQPWNRHAKDLPRVYSVAEYLALTVEFPYITSSV